MPTTAASTASDVLCSLSLAPSGHLVFRSGGAAGHPLPSRTVERIEAAFSHGPGHGLLLLGLDELGGELGPLLGYWRDAARLLITKLRGFLDLDEAIASGLKVPLEADEAASLLAAAPPMPGLEYLSEDALRSAWNETAEAFSAEVRSSGGGAEAFFKGRNAVWSAVGRVFFHLAENKARPDLPFAFLATYTSRVSSHGKLQHVPLGRAVKEQAAAANRNGLLSLLVPVQKAAAESPFLKEMVDSGRVFQPQAWTPHEAHQFLRETPLYESKGIFVRVPNWWNPRSPPRVRVGVTVGRGQAAGLGADALLDFSVQASLEGEPLSEEEWRENLDREGGLALVKGRWVEVDREKLAELLRHWKSVEKAARRGGVSFLEGMRLLSRLPLEGASSSETEAAAASPASEWLTVEAGEWLRGILEELRSPTSRGAELSPEELRAALRPYQAEGVKWLWLLHKLRLGACL
ncbi:MAG: ATP-dependent helicase, partial [Planctomycetes bacterium]|nr:ATP-dependent helicase [Planctomycetota bacterium]